MSVASRIVAGCAAAMEGFDEQGKWFAEATLGMRS